MADEILIKAKLDVEGFKAEIQEAKKEGNSLISELEKKDIKLKVTPVVDQKNVESSFSRLKDNISSKFSEITNGISDQLKGVGASATAAFNTVKAAGVSSFRAVGSAIAASGIGLLPILLGVIAANWDKITTALTGTTKSMKALDDATKESSKELEKAFEKVNKVSIAFEEAKKGVLSKEKALKIYNETLGKSLGAAQSLEEAEKIYRNNTEAFIKATQARAVAKALEKKAAELQTEALIDTELSMFDKLLTATSVYGFIRSNSETEIKKRRRAEKEKEAQDILDIATQKNNEALVFEKQYSKEIEEVQKDLGEKTKKNSKNVKKELKKDIREVLDFTESIITGTESQVSDPKRYKEITEVIKKAEEDKANSLLSSYDRELNAIKENYGAKILEAESFQLNTTAIEQEMFDKIAELNKKKAEDDAKITEQILKNQNSIVTGTENQVSKIEELLARQKDAVNDLYEFAKNGILLQIGLNPQDVDRVRLSLENLKKTFEDKESTPAEKGLAAAQAAGAAYQTISNSIFNADSQRRQEELAALQTQKEEELRIAGDNEQKKELIRQKYALRERDIKRRQAEADKRKAIFDATINTALAVLTGFVRGGPVLAAIAGAIGAAQIALIAAQPIPKFAKGVVDFNGKGGIVGGEGTGTSDSNLAYLSKGESVIPAESTNRNLGLVHELVNGDVNEYINRHYVMPALQAKESKANEIYKHSRIEAENNLIARVSSHTLKSIHKEQKNTTEAIKRLDKKDFKW